MASTSRSLPLRTVSMCVASLLVAGPLLAQQQDRVSRECRQEIAGLCGTDRSQIRSCLSQRGDELSNQCRSEMRARMGENRTRGERRGQQPGPALRAYQASIPVSQTVLYGGHIRQQVDIYKPKDAVDDLPLVLFVHGGGWSMGDHKSVQAKPAHFTGNGYIFASTGYRLLPESPVEEQARDVGAAIRALVGQARTVGVDPSRIVVMGHSAGAHLAALVASDPQYAGDAFGAIKGVILLDGAGYDVAANMEEAGPRGWQIYNAAFGTEPARQAALSPVTHVGGEDAPNWLALYVTERSVAKFQAETLASALGLEGRYAEALPIRGTDHARMNRELGTEAGAAQTQAVDAFLETVFER